MQQILKDIKKDFDKLEVLLDETIPAKEVLTKPTIKIDIADYDRIELNWGYREGISIMREGDKIHIDRERCVPNGPDDIDSDYEELLTINI